MHTIIDTDAVNPVLNEILKAELAGVVGPYDGYALNAEAHKRVMRKHAAANDDIRTLHSMDGEIHQAATKAWAEGNKGGARNGWRNAQAAVLAPTGTISFLMDCDTTGIEPDFSLVKFKELVGGGSMTIVNGSVPMALRNLDYSEAEIAQIESYINENNTNTHNNITIIIIIIDAKETRRKRRRRNQATSTVVTSTTTFTITNTNNNQTNNNTYNNTYYNE